MEEFNVRLNNALQARHMTAAELSRIIGIDQGTMSCYRSGKYKPMQNRLNDMAKALNVSIAYLFGADVEMGTYEIGSDRKKERQEDNKYDLDPVEREIIETYRKADGKQKLRIGSIVQEIAEEIEKNHSGTNGNGASA